MNWFQKFFILLIVLMCIILIGSFGTAIWYSIANKNIKQIDYATLTNSKVVYKDGDIKILNIDDNYFIMPINGGTLTKLNNVTGQNIENKYKDSLHISQKLPIIKSMDKNIKTLQILNGNLPLGGPDF